MMNWMATPEEIAWAAGIFEGEGSMTVVVLDSTNHPHAVNPHYNVRLRVNMTDHDVVRRFHQIVGVGYVGPKNHNTHPHWKPQLLWQAGARKDLEDLLALFMPWLGERRRARAEEILEHASRNRGTMTGWSRRPKIPPEHEWSRKPKNLETDRRLKANRRPRDPRDQRFLLRSEE